MMLVINTFVMKLINQIGLSCVKNFGLSPSVSCLINRNSNNKECLL